MNSALAPGRDFVLVRLMGGLGNQMFQYATARCVAAKRGAPLKLDLSWFGEVERKSNNDTPRTYALDGWRIRADIATAKDLDNFPSYRRYGRLGRLRALLSWPSRNRVVMERSLEFNEHVLSATPPVQLIGYWQSEKYFASIRTQLCEEFSLAGAPCEHAVALREHVRTRDAIAVHVRRGDFANNPKTNAYHGVCSITYYQNAVTLLARRVRRPEILLFTDDPRWVREHLRFPWPTTLVDHRNAMCPPHNDILLMAECAHNVTANSSFSWWGAWLGESSAKTVVAPKQWFGSKGPEARDLVPERWLRM